VAKPHCYSEKIFGFSELVAVSVGVVVPNFQNGVSLALACQILGLLLLSHLATDCFFPQKEIDPEQILSKTISFLGHYCVELVGSLLDNICNARFWSRNLNLEKGEI